MHSAWLMHINNVAFNAIGERQNGSLLRTQFRALIHTEAGHRERAHGM